MTHTLAPQFIIGNHWFDPGFLATLKKNFVLHYYVTKNVNGQFRNGLVMLMIPERKNIKMKSSTYLCKNY